MAWQRVALVVEGDHAEALREALEAAGALADRALRRRRRHARASTPCSREPGADATLWPRSRVSALFAGDADARARLGAALAACGTPRSAAASLERVEDADWVALTQRQFEPIRVGRAPLDRAHLA